MNRAAHVPRRETTSRILSTDDERNPASFSPRKTSKSVEKLWTLSVARRDSTKCERTWHGAIKIISFTVFFGKSATERGYHDCTTKLPSILRQSGATSMWFMLLDPMQWPKMLRARAYNRKAKSEDRGTVQVSSDYRLIFSGLATVKLDFLFFYFISRYEYASCSSIRPSVICSDETRI